MPPQRPENQSEQSIATALRDLVRQVVGWPQALGSVVLGALRALVKKWTSKPEPEHLVAEEPSGLARPMVAWLLALGPVVIGAFVSIEKARVLAGTRTAWQILFDPKQWGSAAFDPVTALFWFLCLFWSVVLALRLQRVDALSRERRMSLIRAVHRVPNLNVVKDYRDFYNQIATILRAPPAGDDVDALAKPVRKAISLVAEMAQQFARGSKATYSANVMLALAPAECLPAHRDVLRFNGEADLSTRRAVLYLPSALRSASDAGTPAAEPVIALPVAREEFDERGRRRVLPSAPWTLQTGNPGTYEDTHTIGQYCEDFDRAVREEVQEYFTKGPGKDYRSFASFRIDLNDLPVGVLNIDSNAADVLGSAREYYVTFYALMEPVLHLLAPHVAATARAAYAALQRPAEAPNPAESDL